MGINYSEGTYSCIVKEQSMAVSKNGNDMIVFRCRPEALVVADEEGNESLDSSIICDFDCWARLTIIPTNESGLEMTMKKLRYAGFKGSSFAELDFVGKPIILLCRHKMWDGKQTENWELPLPEKDQKEPAKMEPSHRRKLDALFAAKGPYLSANPGPSAYAGEKCSPWFFAQYQNDTYDEAAGKVANEKGYKNVLLIAPNYPAGKDHLNGFKRLYKGAVKDEIYTKLGQIDYAAEIAQIRAAKPDAVFFFLPGAMGINFVKQFVGGGLEDIPLIAPGFSADEDVIQAVGEPMLGVLNTAHWTHDLQNPANAAFVSAFRQKYAGRYPSVYAAMAYDTLMAMDAAVRDVGGRIDDRDAVLKALSGSYPPLQVTALRGLTAMPLVCLYVLWRGQLRFVFSRHLRWGLHLLRGLTTVLMMALFMVTMSGRFAPAMTMITNAVDARYRGGFMSVNAALQQAASGCSSMLAGLFVSRTAAGQLAGLPLLGYVSAGFFGLAVLLAFALRAAAPHVAKATPHGALPPPPPTEAAA